MLVKVVHRNIRISPRKAIHVCRLVNRQPLEKAYRILESIPREKTVTLLQKLFKEAANNAVHNYALNGDILEIHECTALKGASLKRGFPRAKGRTDLRLHRFSHLKVVLKEKERVSTSSRKAPKLKSIKLGAELSTKKIDDQAQEGA
ncbi:large ribosomal subunit protein uL22 [Candidatus Mycoplasma haematominutum]|uniref:50S ribosomal protein L22 n=1 Tax=Candidatus Mycoplasma haematominutum 'Birmingham 1' TaxID=1116213 RepID=G8C320_9MOLU|nr:uL22 family ribosomal protein [Candidatus Mycoplasma haematominutum]CCE66718.1 ribosomal protein L22 [Candidatus Mycoplasma haematominutum 'Birmingham 1']